VGLRIVELDEKNARKLWAAKVDGAGLLLTTADKSEWRIDEDWFQKQGLSACPALKLDVALSNLRGEGMVTSSHCFMQELMFPFLCVQSQPPSSQPQ
jgi:hypothetical protein